jgi:predicted DNA-binding transcriptional regulator AlpA
LDSDSWMFAAISAHLPELRKTASSRGVAFHYCPTNKLHATMQRGRLTVQKCSSLNQAREIELAIGSLLMLSIAETEDLTRHTHAQLIKLERAGRFPRRRKIKRRMAGWLAVDVHDWLARREKLTMSGTTKKSDAAEFAEPPATPWVRGTRCFGCGERLKIIKVDDFGGERRLLDAWNLYFASIGEAPCTGLCKRRPDPLYTYRE